MPKLSTLTLLLIRHGETAWNAEARFRGQTDIALSPRGRRQAKALAHRLPPSYPVDHIYSSPLPRCLETARPLAAALGLAVMAEPRLIDLDYGEWSGRPIAEVAEQSPQEYAAWLGPSVGRPVGPGYLSFCFPGGEPLGAPLERLRSFVDDVIERHQGDVVAMVTHNVLCQMATCLLLDRPPESFQSVRHDPGNFSVFRWEAGAFREDGLNVSPEQGRPEGHRREGGG